MDDAPEPAPPPAATTPAVRPGHKTTEFAFGLLAALLTALYASGVIPTAGTWATIAAIAAITLTALGYTVSRTMVKRTGGLLLLAFALSASQPACAHPPSPLKVAMVTLTAASDGFTAWDKAHQMDIVAKATSEADGQAKLGAYRARRGVAMAAVEQAYRAIAAAALLKADKTNAIIFAQAAAKALADLQGAP